MTSGESVRLIRLPSTGSDLLILDVPSVRDITRAPSFTMRAWPFTHPKYPEVGPVCNFAVKYAMAGNIALATLPCSRRASPYRQHAVLWVNHADPRKSERMSCSNGARMMLQTSTPMKLMTSRLSVHLSWLELTYTHINSAVLDLHISEVPG